jgi:antagonist of KipI
MKFLRYGPQAILIEFAVQADAAALDRSRRLMQVLEGSPPARLRELVPSFCSLLCEFQPGTESDFKESWRLLELAVANSDKDTLPLAPSRLMELPITYGGPDLDRVACYLVFSATEVVERHRSGRYRVHCLGFAPGFPYLGGLDSRLNTPRLPTPRLRVAPGSVGIGGEHTGIYSLPTSGGWNLIGSTSVRLFRPEASEISQMFHLRPGDEVRFVQPTDPRAGASDSEGASLAGRGKSLPCLRVLHPGIRTTIQDMGRPGWRRYGVPPGGAMDPLAAAEANLLVGNPPDAPVLELCLQGQQFQVLNGAWIAIGGPSTGGTLRRSEAQWMSPGSLLQFPYPFQGTWAYLGIEGGVDSSRILGSASANHRAGMGRELAVGDVIEHRASHATSSWAPIARRLLADLAPRDYPHPPVVRVWPGPQWNQFSDRARQTFFASTWKVSAQSDRAGYRLEGPEVAAPSHSLISEPVLVGSIQIPPSGQPIITLPDGPTIGGYHKLGVVDPEDLIWVVQTSPGRSIRFEPVSV